MLTELSLSIAATSTPWRLAVMLRVISCSMAWLRLAVMKPMPIANPRATAITPVRRGSRRRLATARRVAARRKGTRRSIVRSSIGTAMDTM